MRGEEAYALSRNKKKRNGPRKPTSSSPRRALTFVAVLLASVSIGWLDPHTTAREGNRLFAEGKYEQAEEKYNQALVDQPDSPALHFNLGDATYKQGKYTEAINAFQAVSPANDEPERIARVAYNIGNAKYRIGEAAEASDPKTALSSYAEALVTYRRAMGADPSDPDIKFNYEFVEKKLADLKKKLEEQQQNEEQQASPDQEQEQQPDKQGEEDQADEQQGTPEEKEEQAQEQQQSPQQAEGVEEQPDETDGEMSQQEAVALLDSQQDQEVQPDEIIKRLQGAAVAEPAQDW